MAALSVAVRESLLLGRALILQSAHYAELFNVARLLRCLEPQLILGEVAQSLQGCRRAAAGSRMQVRQKEIPALQLLQDLRLIEDGWLLLPRVEEGRGLHKVATGRLLLQWPAPAHLTTSGFRVLVERAATQVVRAVQAVRVLPLQLVQLRRCFSASSRREGRLGRGDQDRARILLPQLVWLYVKVARRSWRLHWQ